MKNKGIFIAFEGIDGCGKTTQINLLNETLLSNGIKTLLTKEPTDNDIGKLLREYLTGKKHTDNRAIAPLFAADRLDHITCENGILNTLMSGTTVLCDRYYLSSYAYHSVDCDMDWVIETNKLARELAKPDLHIFLDVPYDISMQRVKARGETELFEQLERQKQIRDNFLKLFDILKGDENILIVDGTGDREDIAKVIREKVMMLFN